MSNTNDIDINGLSLSELKAKIAAYEAAAKKLDQERGDKIREVRTALVTYELGVDDIFPDFIEQLATLQAQKGTFVANDVIALFSKLEVNAKKPRAKRGTAVKKAKGEAKYRNSLDPSITWSGQGRKPGWVNTYLENGGKLEDLLIATETQEGE